MNRFISSQITKFLSRTPLRPNHVTTLAFVLGIVAGFCMARGNREALLWGAFWLHASFILDNCDGELARLKKAETPLGAVYDLVADVIVDYALWMGLAMGAYAMHGEAWYGWAAAACAGSTLNLAVVIWERRKGCGTSIHKNDTLRKHRNKNIFLRLLDFLSHNGDVIYLVWLAALLGRPELFLSFGCVYIHLIWIGRFLSHRKVLLS